MPLYDSSINKITVKVDDVNYFTDYTLSLNDGKLGLINASCGGIFDNVYIKYNY